MTINRAVDRFRSLHEMSIKAHDIEVWASPHLEHIDQEAAALAGRVYMLNEAEPVIANARTSLPTHQADEPLF